MAHPAAKSGKRIIIIQIINFTLMTVIVKGLLKEFQVF